MFSPTDHFWTIVIFAGLALTVLAILATVIGLVFYMRRVDRIRSDSADRTDFLASVGHELREPLHAIVEYANKLLKKTTDQNLVADVTKIQRSAEHLLALASDVLDIARMTSGRTRANIVAVNLRDIMENISASTERLLTKNNNTLTIKINDDASSVISDPIRLRQLLWNLVSNAAKYTENGNVTVNITKERGVLGTMLVIRVKDTGIGISKADQKKIFGSFVRVNSDFVRNQEGTGLGLSIAKSICNLLGGDLSVDSEVGKGSEFKAKILLINDQTSQTTDMGA